VIEAPCRSAGRVKQAVVRRARRGSSSGHAILASNTSSMSVSEMGDPPRGRPEKVVGSVILSGLDHALIEVGIEGEETLMREKITTRAQNSPSRPQAADRCGRGAGFVVNRYPQLRRVRVWRAAGGGGVWTSKRIDKVCREARARADGPFYLTDMIGLDTVLHVRSTCTGVTATASSSTSR